MLAFVAPLLAFLTVPNGEGDELAAMRAAVEAGLPSTAAGPQRESRTAGELDDIYRQRGQEGKITGCISSNALGPCMDYCTRVQGSLDNYCALLQGSLGN